MKAFDDDIFDQLPNVSDTARSENPRIILKLPVPSQIHIEGNLESKAMQKKRNTSEKLSTSQLSKKPKYICQNCGHLIACKHHNRDAKYKKCLHSETEQLPACVDKNCYSKRHGSLTRKHYCKPCNCDE